MERRFANGDRATLDKLAVFVQKSMSTATYFYTTSISWIFLVSIMCLNLCIGLVVWGAFVYGCDVLMITSCVYCFHELNFVHVINIVHKCKTDAYIGVAIEYAN